MKDVPTIGPIALDKVEQALLDRIDFDPKDSSTPEQLNSSCSTAADLMRSLCDRNAVPAIRVRYFTDPGLHIGGRGKSRKAMFEVNETKGEEILQHPSFLKHLRYFIFGPDLRSETVERFRQIIIDDAVPSGMLLDQLCQFARDECRGFPNGRRTDLHDEFFKLALECGLRTSDARRIRDAVLQVKR